MFIENVLWPLDSLASEAILVVSGAASLASEAASVASGAASVASEAILVTSHVAFVAPEDIVFVAPMTPPLRRGGRNAKVFTPPGFDVVRTSSDDGEVDLKAEGVDKAEGDGDMASREETRFTSDENGAETCRRFIFGRDTPILPKP